MNSKIYQRLQSDGITKQWYFQPIDTFPCPFFIDIEYIQFKEIPIYFYWRGKQSFNGYGNQQEPVYELHCMFDGDSNSYYTFIMVKKPIDDIGQLFINERGNNIYHQFKSIVDTYLVYNLENYMTSKKEYVKYENYLNVKRLVNFMIDPHKELFIKALKDTALFKEYEA